MPKRKPIANNQQILKAMDRAKLGKGRQLAKILKALPEEDLAKALGRVYEEWGRLPYSGRPLVAVISYACGRQEQRRVVGRRIQCALEAGRLKVTLEQMREKRGELKSVAETR